jgi:hypothetical protein
MVTGSGYTDEDKGRDSMHWAPVGIQGFYPLIKAKFLFAIVGVLHNLSNSSRKSFMTWSTLWKYP